MDCVSWMGKFSAVMSEALSSNVYLCWISEDAAIGGGVIGEDGLA